MKKFIVFLFFTVLTLIIWSFPMQALASQKRIEVDLTNQRLYAYDGGNVLYNFPVSTGKIRTPTPTGRFLPYVKLRYTTMQGGSNATGDYYNLPNVPYVIYFYNSQYPKGTGYALHGTYWHNNFGHPMSHGCVNLRNSDMALLYNWIDLNVTVISIYGSTPVN